jgi:ATP-dependent DNA ligase
MARRCNQHACSIGLEGVVSKVRDSKYVSGRSNDWLKTTCAQRETLPIAGFAIKNNEFDGIYIGRHKGKGLVYAGKVDHGFDKASVKDLQTRLKPLIRRTQPYAKKITHRGIWVEPSLLAESEYRAKSAEGKVRHPFYKAFERTSDETHSKISDLVVDKRSQIRTWTAPAFGSKRWIMAANIPTPCHKRSSSSMHKAARADHAGWQSG